MTLSNLIVDLSHDPFNPELNFKVALEYDKLKQTASATSFYLRTAEYGYESHVDLAYASILKMAKCFEHQTGREHTVMNCWLQALALNPTRPEVYFFISQQHERNARWQEAYTWASMGLTYAETEPLPAKTDYHGTYCLEFEKAVSAWWIGRKDESKEIFDRLVKDKTITQEYKSAVRNNLKQIWQEEHP